MRDCSKADMRELLPDLLHDRLPADVRGAVQAHVESCANCRAELELLTHVRAAVRAPAIDSSHIAAALQPYRDRSLWSRAAESPQLRIAAAIVLVAGSIWVLWGPGRPGGPSTDVTSAALATGTQSVVSAPVQGTSVANELAVGEPLADLTEGDLHALIEELDELDAVTPAESEVEMPSVRGGE